MATTVIQSKFNDISKLKKENHGILIEEHIRRLIGRPPGIDRSDEALKWLLRGAPKEKLPGPLLAANCPSG